MRASQYAELYRECLRNESGRVGGHRYTESRRLLALRRQIEARVPVDQEALAQVKKDQAADSARLQKAVCTVTITSGDALELYREAFG